MEGRFSRMGVELHNTVTEMLQGRPECRLCTHGKPTEDDWALFRRKAEEWWGVDVPDSAIDPHLLGAGVDSTTAKENS